MSPQAPPTTQQTNAVVQSTARSATWEFLTERFWQDQERLTQMIVEQLYSGGTR